MLRSAVALGLSAVLAGGALLGGCTAPAARAAVEPTAAQPSEAHLFREANRLTWGADSSVMAQLRALGYSRYVAEQLHPAPARLPPAVQAQIDAMTISRRPMIDIARAMAEQRRQAVLLADDDAKKAALKAWQQDMTRLGREAQTREILHALYSPNQVQEEMTWFWANHFNVFLYKGNIRATVGDYVASAIRPHALGKFRDLLGAVAHHPAMLVYLDNVQNAAGHDNENYAREIMELHTMGVGSGYTQQDVQQLARIMTGVGVSYRPGDPRLPPRLRPYYVRDGAFEFNPRRHDFGPKVFLGETIRGHGLAEFDEALDRLASSPATAHFISRQLAVYWLSDNPPPALIERMAQTYLHTGGDIASVLHTLFMAPEFMQAAGTKFKDPMRYVISSVRLAYDSRTILNARPIVNWLARMGEPLYGHQTPDGYPMTEADWASPGQMETRFEVARAIGSGSAGLFRSDGPQPIDRPAFPQMANALYYEAFGRTLGPATRKALQQAASPQEWNTLLLSSPEFMHR